MQGTYAARNSRQRRAAAESTRLAAIMRAERESSGRVVTLNSDASHAKGGGRMGVGVHVEVTDDARRRTGELARRIYADRLAVELGVPGADLSNPTLELHAATVALRRAAPMLRRGDVVTLRADYIGVRNYAADPPEWKPKPASKTTRDNMAFQAAVRALVFEASRVRELCVLVVEHVRGHSGDPGNEAADRLATSPIDKDTFAVAFAIQPAQMVVGAGAQQPQPRVRVPRRYNKNK